MASISASQQQQQQQQQQRLCRPIQICAFLCIRMTWVLSCVNILAKDTVCQWLLHFGHGMCCARKCVVCCVAGAAADVYIVCNLSCVDLPGLEEYVQEVSVSCFSWRTLLCLLQH
jgi:hypothetical protein